MFDLTCCLIARFIMIFTRSIFVQLKVTAFKKEPPPYGKRQGWIPRKLEVC